MGPDGDPVGAKRKKPPFESSGFLDLKDPFQTKWFKWIKKAATFETAKTADAAALKAGWQVKDGEGPNHRCPKCFSDPAHVRRGAYINWEQPKTANAEPGAQELSRRMDKQNEVQNLPHLPNPWPMLDSGYRLLVCILGTPKS
jgi:hypothetical protein